MEGREAFNIRYDVVGRVDGLWTIQAYDRNDNKIGISVSCMNPTDVLKLFMMVNGVAVVPEDTTEIFYEVA